MKLFLLTYPTSIDNEAQVINTLFNEGLDVLHLRKPDYTMQETERLLNAIDSTYYSRIALHQHHSIAFKFGISRIHFSEKNRLVADEEEFKRWKENGFVLSTSIHSILEYELLSEYFSYAFLGPVFESISKPGYKPGSDKIELTKEAYRATEIIAIGGITADKMEEVKRANFDGTALLGAIWNDTANAVKIIKKCREFAVM